MNTVLSRRGLVIRGSAAACSPSVRTASDAKLAKLGVQLLHVLGRGTQGTVFKALKAGAEVSELAVKICAKPRSRFSSSRSSQTKEMEVWSHLSRNQRHGRITRVLDSWENLMEAVIVQEYAGSYSLQALLESHGPLPEMALAEAADAILCVLEDCHSHNILHGDIKPANFVARNDWLPPLDQLASTSSSGSTSSGDTFPLEVRAIDFGSSTQLPYKRATLTDGPRGTPMFQAPEAVKGEGYGLAADMWACGVTLFLLATNALPFWADSLDECLMMAAEDINCGIIDGCLIINSNLWSRYEGCGSNANMPFEETLEHLVCRMLEKDPARRITVTEAQQHPWLQRWRQRLAARGSQLPQEPQQQQQQQQALPQPVLALA